MSVGIAWCVPQDGTAGRQLLTAVVTDHPTVGKAWADMGYKNAVVEHGATLGIDLCGGHLRLHHRQAPAKPVLRRTMKRGPAPEKGRSPNRFGERPSGLHERSADRGNRI